MPMWFQLCRWAVSGPTLDAQGGAGSGIVTGVFVARGDEVAAAERVAEVAGRPVFASCRERHQCFGQCDLECKVPTSPNCRQH